jgi:hypothetical protein
VPRVLLVRQEPQELQAQQVQQAQRVLLVRQALQEQQALQALQAQRVLLVRQELLAQQALLGQLALLEPQGPLALRVK